MPELTQSQLEEMVVGKNSKARATFYEKAALNVSASKLHNRRIYRPTVYVTLIQPGVTDGISYPAKKADIEEYPEEYQHFMLNRQGKKKSVKIEIIPGLDIIHMQELIDMGLSTLDRLAESLSVPEHLEYARESAIALNRALQEQADGNNQTHEESPTEETYETKNVHASHRPGNHSDVGQCIVPPRIKGRRDDSAERVRESGFVNSGKDVTPKSSGILTPAFPSSNWKMSF